MSTTVLTPRIGARVLLLDADDRVLLIHACDPHDRGHEWWELPGGGLHVGETPVDAARREVAEETGIVLSAVGRKLWVRESRFHYKGRDHHRVDHVYLARVSDTAPKVALQYSEDEKAGLLERRWWSAAELCATSAKMLPARLPDLIEELLAGTLSAAPLILSD